MKKTKNKDLKRLRAAKKLLRSLVVYLDLNDQGYTNYMKKVKEI